MGYIRSGAVNSAFYVDITSHGIVVERHINLERVVIGIRLVLEEQVDHLIRARGMISAVACSVAEFVLQDVTVVLQQETRHLDSVQLCSDLERDGFEDLVLVVEVQSVGGIANCNDLLEMGLKVCA
jgi:hypothetical protein